MGPGLATFALEKIFEVLLLSPDAGKEWERRKEMGCENHCRAERANCRNDDAAMSGQPMHSGDFRSPVGLGQFKFFACSRGALSPHDQRPDRAGRVQRNYKIVV